MSTSPLAAELNRFREKLLDLSNSNPLLNYRRSRTSTLSIIDELPDQIFKRLVTDGKRFRFQHRLDEEVSSNGDDDAHLGLANHGGLEGLIQGGSQSNELPEAPRAGGAIADRHTDDKLQTDRSEASLDTVIKEMGRRASTAIEETGVNYQFLVLGMLAWQETEHSREQLAPLILIPVTIERFFDGRSSRYEQAVVWRGEEIQGNLCLAKRLERDFGLRLPSYENDLTPEQYFESVQREICAGRNWSVRREALMGFFSFQKLLMYLDIDPSNWESTGAIRPDSVASQVIWGRETDSSAGLYASTYAVDLDPKTKDLIISMDADSSQHSALADISRGQNLVIEGPPGTGKSQTIANAIAIAMCEGKTILFVAEKLAALEVVHHKLTMLGLGDFCLELHSDAASPRQIFKSLKQRLDANYEHPHQLEALNEELERKKQLIADYLKASSRIVGPDKEPLYQLVWRVIDERGRGRDSLRSAKFECDISRSDFNERIQHLEAFAESLLEIDNPKKCPWWGFWPNHLNPNDCRPVSELLEKLTIVNQNRQASMAAMDQEFGHKLGEWVEGQLGSKEIVTEISALMSQAATLKEGETIRVLLTPESRKIAREFAEVVNEKVHLENGLANQLLDTLEKSIQPAEILSDLLEKEFIPLFPKGTWTVLKKIQPRLGSLTSALEKAMEVAEQMRRQGLGNVRNLAEYEKSEFLGKLVRHPVVANRTDLPASLFFRSAQATVMRAKSDAETLLERRVALEKSFDFDAMPSSEQLLELTKRLRVHANSWFGFLSKDCRSALQKLAEFRQPSAKYKLPQWIENLQAALKWQNDFAAFRTKREYSGVLGDAFQGVETDWTHCETLLKWIAAAQSKGIDHAGAIALLRSRDGSCLNPHEIDSAKKLLKSELSDVLIMILGFGRSTSALEVPFADALKSVRQLKASLSSAVDAANIFSIADNSPLTEILRLGRTTIRAAKLKSRLHDEREWSTLGPWYQADLNSSVELRSATELAESLCRLNFPSDTENAILDSGFRNGLNAIRGFVELQQQNRSEWERYRQSLAEFGDMDSNWLSWRMAGDAAKGLGHALESLQRRIEILPAWSAFCRARTQCDALGLEDFTRAVLDDQIDAADIARCYRFSLLERVVEASIHGSNLLKGFSRKTIEKARHRFRELDLELLRLNRVFVAHQASQRRAPSGSSQGRVIDYTEMGLIRHEIQKQQQHSRIRDLLKRAGTAAQALKPCFMMSPLSVSQFLDPTGVQFDLVIMDEASQIKPEDALGTLLRAKQLVVVGDPKQLPPSSFFDRTSDDVDNEDATQFDNVESVLEVAMKAFQPVRRLTWHYRSKHESLIQFSNDRFYDGDLIVFPSASGLADNLGLRYHPVDGGYFENGGNVHEAEVVALAIIEHAKTTPTESLGVGTFNLKQSGLILDWVQRLCEKDALAREAMDNLNSNTEKLFVKNLENLQGDERDVIFISYTYGPDRTSGRVFNRFGPVNGKTGWRRINVLVSRARKRLEVFSSLNPSDIQAGPDKSDGVNAFRAFLDYAQTGRLADRGEITGRDIESPFEEAVARVIQKMGFDVVPQVGVAGYFIDLGVRHKGDHDFLLGIECDGAAYHSSKSARDRDRLREEIILSRGWTLHRIWSTDWYLNQRHEEQRLRNALEEAALSKPSVASAIAKKPIDQTLL
jgi:very-short-patch-repair endonuclease